MSCESEYEERLKQGLHLKERLALMERSSDALSDEVLQTEIETIRNEIVLLAKVSGNEELFLSQVFND